MDCSLITVARLWEERHWTAIERGAPTVADLRLRTGRSVGFVAKCLRREWRSARAV